MDASFVQPERNEEAILNQFQAQLTFADGQTMAEKRFGVNTAPAPQKVTVEEFERKTPLDCTRDGWKKYHNRCVKVGATPHIVNRTKLYYEWDTELIKPKKKTYAPGVLSKHR